MLTNIKPLVIGIAGDSCSGKTYLSNLLKRTFNEQNIQHVSGDNYHIAERHNAIWDSVTHLAPEANHLDRLAEDIVSLCKGGAVTQPIYDHHLGKFDNLIRLEQRPLIISEGLHALYNQPLRQYLDIGVYMDIDEPLRRHLKILRDTKERSYTHSEALKRIDNRLQDARSYIHPQRYHADIIITIAPYKNNIADIKDTNDLSSCNVVITGQGNAFEKLCSKIAAHPDLNHLFDHISSHEFAIHPKNQRLNGAFFSSLMKDCLAEKEKLQNIYWLCGTQALIQTIMLLLISIKRPAWLSSIQ